jgi:ribose transport system permease protein
MIITMKKLKLKINGNAAVMLIAIGFITAIFTAINSNFFTYRNLINVLVSSTLNGLCAIGMTFLMMIGGTDLSAGCVAAAAGVIMAWGNANTSIPWPILIVCILCIGALAGLINATLVRKLKIVPFIATLATQYVWKGVAYLVCGGQQISMKNAGFENFCKGRLFGENGIPYPVVLTIILFAIFGYILSSTRFGRKVFAIGGNPEAARLAGINSERVIFTCYIMISVLSAFAGIILCGRMNSGNPASNANLHFEAIIGANLAGVSMVGGVGSVPVVFLGVALVQAFNAGLNMAQVSPYWQYVARGALLIGSLTIDYYRQRRREQKLLADSMKNLQ